MRSLVLSFDINKTIIMRDGGVPVPSMVNSLMSETIWGVVHPSISEEAIKCEGPECSWQEIGVLDPEFKGNPSDLRPSLDSFTIPNREEFSSKDIMTYDDFLEKRATSLEKKSRKILKRRFCTHELGPGKRLLDVYNRLLDSLEMPEEGVKAAREQEILDIFQKDGTRHYYSLVPAFFKVIDTLYTECSKKDAVVDVRILFRTFGDDLDDVGREYNLYCEGKHPVHKPSGDKTYDGTTPGYVDRRIRLPHFIGKVKRSQSSASSEGLYLAHVNHKRDGRTVTLTEGASEVYQMIHQDWFGLNNEGGGPPLTYSAGIQDDYEYWAANHEDAHAGKIFMVDKIDNQQSALQLFFDDNIERSHVHIVDVRQPDFTPVDIDAVWTFPNGHDDSENFFDALTNVLTLNESVDEYQIAALDSLVKVMPRRIVADENYYVDIVKRYLLRRGIEM